MGVNPMFTPKELYERAPFFWVTLGAVLVMTGIYFGAAVSPIYSIAGVGCGAAAFVRGLLVFRKRMLPDVERSYSAYDDYLDQTCELNYRPESSD